MAFPHSIWRLIITQPAHGAWNMALDEAILETSGAGQELPALRLYAWDPPCLSLGYAQPMADVDLALLKAHGWELVRRPTGGRAILHTDELTYSIAGPQDEPRLSGGVLDSYRSLSFTLIDALHRLGIPAQAAEKTSTPNPASPSAPKDQNPVCFEVPSSYEITVQGKKLIGSAQARRKQGVLQHGSLPLQGDLSRIVQALAFPDEKARQDAAERLLQRAATAETFLGAPLPWQQAAQAFIQAFEATLNLELTEQQPTAAEMRRAEELARKKYAASAWTETGRRTADQ